MKIKNHKYILFLLLTAIMANCAMKGQQHKEKHNPDNHDMDVFLLIGQSNMQGVAPIGSLDTVTLDNVYLFNDKNKWEPAKNIPDSGMNRYSTVKRKPVTLFGPAYTFGRKIQQYTQHAIGIVSNARGATRIEWWQKGFQHDTSFNGESDFDLFEKAIARTKAALATNPRARLKGILWHQGEADNDPERSPYYMLRLKALVRDLRIEFDNPELPFIAGEVATWNGRGTNVNPIIRNIKKEIPYTDWVSSSGYTSIDLENNDPHFDNLSQRSFGCRYADKAAELIYHIEPKGAILFASADYKGRSVLLTGGRYSAVDIERMGILNTEIASVKVDQGYQISFINENGERDLTASEPSLKSGVPAYIEVKKVKAK